MKTTTVTQTMEDIKTRLKEKAEYSGHPFRWDDDRQRVAKMLLAYNLKDESFKTMGKGFSLSRGNLIMGTIGSGKTALIESASWLFESRPCSFSSCGDDCEDKSHKHEFWRREFQMYVSRNIAKMSQDEISGLVTYGSKICIDDLGFRDDPGKDYGTPTDSVTDLLLDRHDCRLITHATTNLDQEALIKRFGDRMMSRFSEMFNIVVMKGDDLRK